MYRYLKVSFMIAVTVLALQFVDFTSTDAQASDEEYHLRMLEGLKRLNNRMIKIETNSLRSIKDVQVSLLNQVMTIQPSIEQIQSTGELNKSEMLDSIRRAEARIVGIENHLKTEVMAQFAKKTQEDKKFQIKFLPLLVQIEKRLSDQNNALDNTHALLKADLIPALKNENEKMRQVIVAEIAKLRG